MAGTIAGFGNEADGGTVPLPHLLEENFRDIKYIFEFLEFSFKSRQ